jgi:signal transduction histidine kinase
MASDYDNFQRNDHLRFLDLISKSSEAAYNLLENLLLWARSQRGKIELDKKYFDLSNSIKECIDFLNNQAAAKNIVINLSVKENTKV